MRQRTLVGAALLVLIVLLASAFSEEPKAAPRAIALTNYKEGETIRYSVPLIRGELADASETAIALTNTTSARKTREMTGLAYKGRFKILAELLPGENKLILKSGKNELPLTLIYKPQTNPYFVRAVYITDNTENTDYQTPIANDKQDYASKIDTVLKVMQTFTAERLNDLGYGRKTFNLELDDDGKVKVHVFKCPAPAATYYAMNDQVWYGAIAAKLAQPYPTKFAKNFVVAAYTRFDPATQKVQGHTALGGGGQGLFGSGDMFTWPSELAGVQKTFMDTTPIDHTKVFSDSVGRHTFWAAASTTIGACLHECSHAFGLPHSRDPMDIMTRGIDHFNRAFTFVDPPSSANKQPIEFPENRVASFPPISAAALITSRWFALDERAWVDGLKAEVKVDDKNNLVIDASAAITYVGFGVKGEVVYFVAPAAGEKNTGLIAIPLADIRQRTKTDDFNIRILDDQGNMKVIKFPTQPAALPAK